jgi:hypothetical protein
MRISKKKLEQIQKFERLKGKFIEETNLKKGSKSAAVPGSFVM